MFSADDTIVAISTPLGRGAIGMVRMSGPRAAIIAGQLAPRLSPLAPRHATFARLAESVPHESSNRTERAPGVRDQVVVTFFPAPHSATGDDVVEISAHGSPVVLRSILAAAIARGARLAEPGEFTLRAFLNGKIDLVQAEAVTDLVEAVTPLQARAAFDQLEGTLTKAIGEIEASLFDVMARLEASLDFPEEGYHFVERSAAAEQIVELRARVERLLAGSARGRLIREGAQVAIVGTPNVGKSSVFNTLLNTQRAIVTAIPGTTRDLLTERADIAGLSVALVDTAGLRATGDEVEQEGIARARQAMTVADLTLVVLDRSRPLHADDHAVLESTRAKARLLVANKCDLEPAWSVSAVDADGAVEVSALNGAGMGTLVERLGAALSGGVDPRDQPLVSNVRHAEQLRIADASLARANDALSVSINAVSEEFVLADLQEAAAALQEITGRRTADDLLAHIFSKFCVGK
jgi:tRNA modification GTPase